jgi:hypothetical protein
MIMYLHILFLAVLLVSAPSLLTAQTRESRTYDSQGRIATVTYIQGNQALLVTYAYDLRGNLIKTTSATTTGVDNADPVLTVTVQPNPATQQVTIETPAIDGEIVSIRIVDASGQELASQVSPPATNGKIRVTLDLVRAGLSSGQYVVSASTRNGVRSCAVQLVK